MRFFESPGDKSSYNERLKRAKNYLEEYPNKERPFGGGDILGSCEKVMKMLLARNVTYSTVGLTYNNIRQVYEQGTKICCATYVSLVLYDAGILDEDYLNRSDLNYNYTGDNGIPDILMKSGKYEEVGISQIQPGDVINRYGVHVLIYGGGNLMWDETSVTDRKQGPRSDWNSYKNNSGIHIYHYKGD